MSESEISRIKERSKARKTINTIFDNSARAYLLHYSCQSFYDNPSGGSTRITSIAARNLHSGQTRSWSIHKAAELAEQLQGIPDNLDALEKAMLEGYFAFLRSYPDATFIHWNMRDENFGFAALEHRLKVLKGDPFILGDDRKFDLARSLVTLYGRKYAPHKSATGRKGRLMSIAEINRIADTDALEGEAEAAAFVSGEYLKLHQSTLRKMDMLANIFDRVHANSLKTNATFTDKYGVHPVALIEVIKNHPYTTAVISLAAIGAALANYANFFVWAKNLF